MCLCVSCVHITEGARREGNPERSRVKYPELVFVWATICLYDCESERVWIYIGHCYNHQRSERWFNIKPSPPYPDGFSLTSSRRHPVPYSLLADALLLTSSHRDVLIVPLLLTPNGRNPLLTPPRWLPLLLTSSCWQLSLLLVLLNRSPSNTLKRCKSPGPLKSQGSFRSHGVATICRSELRRELCTLRPPLEF